MTNKRISIAGLLVAAAIAASYGNQRECFSALVGAVVIWGIE